jgi:geranylgeranyl pyrophosphate synthase
MTEPARALDTRPALAQLIDEQFSDSALTRVLEPDEAIPWQLWEQSIYAPLADFLARPGKALRAGLVEAAWSIGGGRGEPPPELGAVIEALHAGSLVIDDIEDGSAYRRNAPALHCAYGLPRALNAGCYLYFWPHALLERMQLPPGVELAARRRIGDTLLGCHLGQALDLGVRVFELEQRDVPRVVRAVSRLKTGNLAEAAAALGAIAAGARSEVAQALTSFGRELGVGLQMLDDLGGLLREDRCHKAHEDLLGARATWPFAWAARELSPEKYAPLAGMCGDVHARRLHPEHLVEALCDELGPEPARRARNHLALALDRLEADCGRSSATGQLRRMLHELEAAYV